MVVLGHSCGLTSHTCLFSKPLTDAQLPYRGLKQSSVISYGKRLKNGLDGDQRFLIRGDFIELEGRGDAGGIQQTKAKDAAEPTSLLRRPRTGPTAKNCSVAESRLTLCSHVDWSQPGSPVPMFAQSHVH